jgi:hypothetical protein
MANQAIEVADPRIYIPIDDLGDVSNAFKDWNVGYAHENFSAYRFTSPINQAEGHWLSFDSSLTSEQARALLALPNGNLATQVTQFIIPRGTNYIIGTVASQTSASWAGSYAVGGGIQIYEQCA